MNVEWQYVAVAVFFVAIGLVVGWYVALKRKIPVEATSHNLFMRAASALLILLAIGSVLQIFYFQREQAQTSDKLASVASCQYRVNKVLVQVLTNRQDPSAAKDAAMTQMVNAILNAQNDDQTRAALRKFISATDALNAARASNPYPTIPSDCRPSD